MGPGLSLCFALAVSDLHHVMADIHEDHGKSGRPIFILSHVRYHSSALLSALEH